MTADGDNDEMWQTLKSGDDLDYILAAGTSGSDTNINNCNIVAGHAYSILSVFELSTGEQVDHKMYMIRNPWSVTTYSGNWFDNDERWTDDYKSQVPFGVDPVNSDKDGIFFAESNDFTKCFDQYEIGHYRDPEGYTRSWYDSDNLLDDILHIGKDYFITVPEKDDDIYLAAETYYYGVTPLRCHPFLNLPSSLQL